MKNNRYQPLEQGSLTVLEGNLGADPDVKVGENFTSVTFSIAVKAGSVQDGNGGFKDLTDWYKLTVFNNGGNSSALLDFIAEPYSEKLAFKKGNRVKFIGYLKKSKPAVNKEGELVKTKTGEVVLNDTVAEFLSLKRIITGTSQSNDNTDTTEPVTTQAPKATSADDIPF